MNGGHLVCLIVNHDFRFMSPAEEFRVADSILDRVRSAVPKSPVRQLI